ncbi:MAG: hypothetical protein CNF00_00025 [Candidatus Thioglobus sp. MED-G25]|nr:MAG: hypothetical protein CNF00_00025 [Candidatus Thioglobus sp. MED-G25]
MNNFKVYRLEASWKIDSSIFGDFVKKSTRMKMFIILFDSPLTPFLLIIGFGMFATIAGAEG